ncbi:hypothetical protein Q1695_002767 [Nippostrongylus brasiliensis]|nr:hypothetical protein Q1695_002767 [Nippostrongylus brasiliensis]
MNSSSVDFSVKSGCDHKISCHRNCWCQPFLEYGKACSDKRFVQVCGEHKREDVSFGLPVFGVSVDGVEVKDVDLIVNCPVPPPVYVYEGYVQFTPPRICLGHISPFYLQYVDGEISLFHANRFSDCNRGMMQAKIPLVRRRTVEEEKHFTGEHVPAQIGNRMRNISCLRMEERWTVSVKAKTPGGLEIT